MARQRFAPDHSLVAAARWIPPDDSAWRHDRINAEYAEMRKGWDPASQEDPVAHSETGHITYRYMGGFTRFDLDAGGLREYLDFEAKPEMWKLRKLTIEQKAELEHLRQTGQTPAYRRKSIIYGVAGLENPANEHGEKLAELLEDGPKGSRSKWEDHVMEALAAYAMDVDEPLAAAVRNLNCDLRATEKKP